MATRLLLEGPDLEELLARVREEHGTEARIVSADRLRRGGVGGFFSKQWFELGVEVPDPAATPAPAPGPALDPGLDPALDTVEALLAMADQADSAPSFGAALSAAESPVDTPEQIAAMQRAALTGIPSPTPAPDTAELPDLAAAIAAALAETATPAPSAATPAPSAAAPAPAPVEVPAEPPVAVAPRVVEPRATTRATTGKAQDNARDKAVAKAREAAKAATAARRTQPASAAPKPAAAKAKAPAKRTQKPSAKPKATTQAKRTAPLRVTSRVDSRPARMTLADAVVAMPGRITVVAGALPHAIAVAEQAVARLRLTPSSLYVAGPAEPGRTERIYGPEHAASLAEELRAGGPVVVAVDAPVDAPDGAAWAAGIADALGADAVVAVVDATRRVEELRRHLTELGTVTAVAIHGTGEVPALHHPVLEY